MTVRAYVRVSTDRQADNGHGLDAQRSAITAETERRSWVAVKWYEDGGWSGKDLERPAMARLLHDLRRGDVLVISKLDRLSRSLVDFAALMERAQRERWNIVALDLGVDLSSPHGEFLASVMAAISRWERRVIGQRTAEGLAAAKAKGILPGRRSRLDRETRERLVTLRESGLSLAKVADQMNAEGRLTVSDRQWRAPTVHSALRTIGLEETAAMCRQELAD